MKGKLYLVATPIGNLEDITMRALNTLKQVDYIAAEDTRQTMKLCNHFDIHKKMISYHRHNEEDKTQVLLEKLNDGKNIALVTDAGTPAISDPGEQVVKKAIENKIDIIPIPGACALINALIPSGLDTKEFCFYGFLPLNKKNRQDKLDKIEKEEKTIILYEAPHKLIKTLQDLEKKLGDRNCVIAKELTKIHEKFIRGTIKEILEQIEEPKGEYIILIEGNKEEKEPFFTNMSLEEHYNYYENKGIEKKEIIKKIAKDRKVEKNKIYSYFIKK